MIMGVGHVYTTSSGQVRVPSYIHWPSAGQYPIRSSFRSWYMTEYTYQRLIYDCFIIWTCLHGHMDIPSATRVLSDWSKSSNILFLVQAGKLPENSKIPWTHLRKSASAKETVKAYRLWGRPWFSPRKVSRQMVMMVMVVEMKKYIVKG